MGGAVRQGRLYYSSMQLTEGSVQQDWCDDRDCFPQWWEQVRADGLLSSSWWPWPCKHAALLGLVLIASCGKTRGPVSIVLHVRGVWMGGQGVQAVSLPVTSSVRELQSQIYKIIQRGN